MRSPWLFVLVFLAYLVGPTSLKHDPREPTRLASASSAPFLQLIVTIYPTAESTDQARWAGRVAGGFWTAAAVAVTFEALSMLASWPTALVLALVTGFASPLWSWASRADTIEAPATLLVALLLWLAALRSRPPRLSLPVLDVASGVVAAALWALDPSLGCAVPLAALVCLRSEPWNHRAAAFATAGAAFTALGLSGLGAGGSTALLPRLETTAFAAFDPSAFAAYIAAPGRSLLLHAPVAALAIAGLLVGSGPRRLARGSALVVLVALFEVASLSDPWGPQAFGPTLLSPLVPLLAAMAATLPAAGLRWGSLVALPVALAHGAVVLGGSTWDSRREPAAHPEAVWDVHDSPFADLVYGPPPPAPGLFLPEAFHMLPGEHTTRAGDAVPWLAFGWEPPEATGTWASGRESWIVLAVPPGDYALTLNAAAPLAEGRPQRLEIDHPGGPPTAIAFTGGPWEFQPVTIHFRPAAGIAILRIRPAQTWRPGRGDLRRLSLFVASLRLQHAPLEPNR